MEIAKKFLSRKLLVAIAAGAVVAQQSGLTGWQAALAISAIAIAYILGEAYIDREGVLLKEVEGGLAPIPPAATSTSEAKTVVNVTPAGAKAEES